MKEILKKVMPVGGYILGIIYALLLLQLIAYHATGLIHAGIIIITVLGFITPYCLSKKKYIKIGMICIFLMVSIFFYYAALPGQKAVLSTVGQGVFCIVLYMTHYYALNKW